MDLSFIKAFPGRIQRESTAFLAGVFLLFLLNVLIAPDIAQIPNWIHFEYLERIMILLAMAYFAGQLILVISWFWIEALSFVWYLPKDFNEIKKWIKHFFFLDYEERERGFTPGELKRSILLLEVTEAIGSGKYQGLKSNYDMVIQQMYNSRVFVFYSLFFFFSVFWHGFDLIPFSWTWLCITGFILFATSMEAIASEHRVDNFKDEAIKVIYKRKNEEEANNNQ